jgi:hypothetical protein
MILDKSDDAMVDVEESASKRVDVAVQGAVECPFLVEDEADELWDVPRAGTLPLLEKLLNTCITSMTIISPAL